VWERECARIFLDQGDELQASLVVGADGADSWVRERAGVNTTAYDYRQTGVVANFAAERPHAATAFQWFRPDGVLALLPLPGDRMSMVWSAPDVFARELLAMSPRQLCDTVESASAAVAGRLELITGAAGFRLRRQRVDRLVEPRLALIGDAAHNVHPLAGQGVNLGLRDARELASVLRERGAQSDCGDYGLLRRYERARKEDILALEAITDGLEKLFSAPAVWMARLRNLGLTLVDLQPPLKTALVRRAAA
jgi:ubiquinone biosynthesis UbiH/UbiF/VisC/COQ6 family hydroxylase